MCTTYQKGLNSGISHCKKAERCGQVQHEEQEWMWRGVLEDIVCVTLGLAALCNVLHVFSDAVHVGDVRPLLRVRVDAHIYQVPQLVEGTRGVGWDVNREVRVNDTGAEMNLEFQKEQLQK